MTLETLEATGPLLDVAADVRVRRLDGTEELILQPTPVKVLQACDWSRDGGSVLFNAVDFTSGVTDLWALPLAAERTPFPVVRRHPSRSATASSPLTAGGSYQSDEEGRPDICLRPFPDPGEPQRVSTGGGTRVRWSQDGAELYYIDPERRLMAVPPHRDATRLTPGTPLELFATGW